MTESGRHLATMLLSASRAYAAGAVDRQIAVQPNVVDDYGRDGNDGWSDLFGDTELRLRFLATAIAINHQDLLNDQVAWLKVAMTARGIPVDYLDENLRSISDELIASLPAGLSRTPTDYLSDARRHLETAPSSIPSYLETGGEHLDLARRYLLALLEARGDDAVAMVLEAHRSGIDGPRICTEIIERAQLEVGRMWQMAEIHVAEEHYGSRVTERVMGALSEAQHREPRRGPKILLAAAGGELHELGLKIVNMHFEWAGIDTLLLGANMPVSDILLAVGDFEVGAVALSASTPLQIIPTVEAIEAIRGHVQQRVPILVGGPPFRSSPGLADKVGADASASTASEAVEICRSLLNSKQTSTP